MLHNFQPQTGLLLSFTFFSFFFLFIFFYSCGTKIVGATANCLKTFRLFLLDKFHAWQLQVIDMGHMTLEWQEVETFLNKLLWWPHFLLHMHVLHIGMYEIHVTMAAKEWHLSVSSICIVLRTNPVLYLITVDISH